MTNRNQGIIRFCINVCNDQNINLIIDQWWYYIKNEKVYQQQWIRFPRFYYILIYYSILYSLVGRNIFLFVLFL